MTLAAGATLGWQHGNRRRPGPYDLRIEIYGATARPRGRGLLAGTPKNVPGLKGWLPRDMAYDFDLTLAKENGRWLIASASWTGAP